MRVTSLLVVGFLLAACGTAPSAPGSGTPPPTLRQRSILDLLWGGHAAVAEGRYDEGIRLYTEAIERGTRFADLDLVVETVRKRRDLGAIEPVATHRICVIWIREVVTVQPGGERRRRADVTEEQKGDWRIYFGLFRRIIEGFSEGGWSVAFSEVDATDTHDADAPHQAGNAEYLGLGRYFFETADECDTYLRISNTFSPARGLARQYPYVSGVAYGPHRGMIRLNPDSHGFMTLLHEFFHVLEWVSPEIQTPAHAYRDSERHRVPEWTGEGEYDYYRWHFATTLRDTDWRTLDHTNRWAHPPGERRDAFEAVSSAYEGIPFLDRLRADSLVAEAGGLDREAAVERLERAVGVSPYHERALERLVELYGTAGRRAPPGAEEYARRLETVRSLTRFVDVTEQIAREPSAAIR